ncbi:histidine phosphatase family protein [Aquabacterium humicola]|uniref:histidine phosphatase family protein n=1 Tax=Aquabacterium humicola TaxID=3237377 RepID=UPI0025434208|nr:histidine phosphatase family protein [Rubrivivax pictus]
MTRRRSTPTGGAPAALPALPAIAALATLAARALVAAALGLGAFAATAQPSLVILVRHADKGSEPVGDPSLSPAGERRAEALAQALGSSGVTAIVTSQFRRTQETAKPLARRLGIEPQVVAARRGEGAAHIAELVQAVRAQRGTVLVVGHGDTVPMLIGALGGPRLPWLCETSYGQAFVLSLAVAPVAGPASPPAAGAAAAAQVPLLRLRYGDPDPPSADGCL